MSAGLRSLLDVLTENRTLPDGYDRWGMKTVDRLRRTANGFFWPEPGGEVQAWDTTIPHGYTDVCPTRAGDGLTVALQPHALSSGGLPVQVILLVAFRQADVVAGSKDKIRTAGMVRVVDEVDLGDHGHFSGVDFKHTDFGGSRLRGDYAGASFCGARLTGAQLVGSFDSADFTWTDLDGATMEEADLPGAAFDEVKAQRASFCSADLKGATFAHSSLSYTTFKGALLKGASFERCDLRYSDINLPGYDGPMSKVTYRFSK